MYFQFCRLRLFQKALVGIFFKGIITADMSKIIEVRVDKKVWILKRKTIDKFITEWSQKNSTQLLWHVKPKKCCSMNLIQRLFISCHLRARFAIKKSYLTARNWLARIVWAKEHALLPKIFWQNVLFSDETTVELHPNKRVWARRLPNTGIENKNFSGARKFGGKNWCFRVLLPSMVGNVSKKSVER